MGLVSENGRPVPRGGQLVWNPTAPKPMPMYGHVTSNCYSPTLGRYIGLALMDDAEDWKGRRLHVASPLASSVVPVRITDHVFVDSRKRTPEGMSGNGETFFRPVTELR